MSDIAFLGLKVSPTGPIRLIKLSPSIESVIANCLFEEQVPYH